MLPVSMAQLLKLASAKSHEIVGSGPSLSAVYSSPPFLHHLICSPPSCPSLVTHVACLCRSFCVTFYSLKVKERRLPNMSGMTLAQKKEAMVETARQSVVAWFMGSLCNSCCGSHAFNT